MKKIANIIILILSSISLLISYKTFVNIAIFVDEHNLSPDKLLGGDNGVYLEWLRLIFLVIIAVLSLVNIFIKEKQ